MRSRTIKLTLLASLVGLSACGRATQQPSSSQRGSSKAKAKESRCPATRVAPKLLPGVRAEERGAAYWVERQRHPDEVLLSVEEIERHNQAQRDRAVQKPAGEALGQYDLLAPVNRSALEKEVGERLSYLQRRVKKGDYVDAKKQKVDPALFEARALPVGKARLQVALVATPLRCGPRQAGLYAAKNVDLAFDRNNCSTLRAQEPVLVLGRDRSGMLLVRSKYALGWIEAKAPLSPPLEPPDAATFAGARRLRVDKELRSQSPGGQWLFARHSLLATRDGKRPLVATSKGTVVLPAAAGLSSSQRPLTRRHVIETAFSFLDSRYGWGGQAGGRDCSRFLMDVLGSFGLEMPRHSGLQAKAGSMHIDLRSVVQASERLALVDAAAEQGIVLLHFPGHIMLYLGRNSAGKPMAIHAFAEYMERCAERDKDDLKRTETLRQVDRVQVSDLALGEGTSRRSFLQRLTAISVLGRSPGPRLLGVAKRRYARKPLSGDGPCQVAKDATVLLTPRRPFEGQPVRVLLTSSRDLGPLAARWTAEGSEVGIGAVAGFGGPPFTYVAELPAPKRGQHQVLFGDGQGVEACLRFRVREKAPVRRAGSGFVWQSRRRWNRAMENLYAAWVEKLFDYPLDDRTWGNLQSLLGDREHNLLFNHLGQDEDTHLALRPDCADLPYFLRGYFAWKLRLPFAFRKCNRGSKGKAPYCDRALSSNLEERSTPAEVAAFAAFARRTIADTVHSGSGRTAPDDERSDYYPVALRRDALLPGTMFADPYGHLFVVVKWVPQGATKYGILIGADAQPDGTIGRRRFWRGSFLFTPDTTEAGAGFKRFRPVVYRGGRVRALSNKSIIKRGMEPQSRQQYELGKDGFYERVESLINPRPLDPRNMQNVLVTALYEQVKRRVVSVQNGEDYKLKHSRSIRMPRGHAIFETQGAWENYSTPSRDMRLLIAMDTVLGFRASVKRSPARFGIAPAKLKATLADLARLLKEQSEQRSVTYRRSDGSAIRLTLAEVMRRAERFEMAYNPNDCVEIRWAAAADSAEASTCKQRAPGRQRKRMRSYRNWFAERRRPAR